MPEKITFASAVLNVMKLSGLGTQIAAFFCTLSSLQAFSLLSLIKSLERVLAIHSLVQQFVPVA